MVLASHAGTTVSQRTLASEAWDWAFEPASNLLEVYIATLRAKIDRPYGRHSPRTVHGLGYIGQAAYLSYTTTQESGDSQRRVLRREADRLAGRLRDGGSVDVTLAELRAEGLFQRDATLRQFLSGDGNVLESSDLLRGTDPLLSPESVRRVSSQGSTLRIDWEEGGGRATQSQFPPRRRWPWSPWLGPTGPSSSASACCASSSSSYHSASASVRRAELPATVRGPSCPRAAQSARHHESRVGSGARLRLPGGDATRPDEHRRGDREACLPHSGSARVRPVGPGVGAHRRRDHDRPGGVGHRAARRPGIGSRGAALHRCRARFGAGFSSWDGARRP